MARTGIGYDIHRLTEGARLVLGGVEVPHDKGPEAHSDGDVLIHAICDAIIGGLGKGDIGRMFPDTDPAYKGIASTELLAQVVRMMKDEGYAVGNVDCVIVAEKPRLASYSESMSDVLGGIMGVPSSAVNIKAKTAEGLGPVGEGEAIAAYASVLLDRRTDV